MQWKVLLSITFQRHLCKTILRDVIICCSVTARTKKKLYFPIYRAEFPNSSIKRLILATKKIPLCPQWHFLRYFYKEKLCFFKHHTEINLCLSSSFVLWNKLSLAPGNIGSNLGQDTNSIVTINHSLTHFNDMCGFASYIR